MALKTSAKSITANIAENTGSIEKIIAVRVGVVNLWAQFWIKYANAVAGIAVTSKADTTLGENTKVCFSSNKAKIALKAATVPI